MAVLASSIADRGVKTPISVRPHPTKANKWIINNGARRYRASVLAKKETIPAFVDEVFDDYDQVIVNDQHATLTPMERARFIAKKIAEGEKKGVIAKKLSIDSASITHHLALIDLPASIDAVYRSGRCTSIKVLYDLRNLHSDFPDAVDQWCAAAATVSRSLVAGLSDVLNGRTTTREASANSIPSPAAAEVKNAVENKTSSRVAPLAPGALERKQTAAAVTAVDPAQKIDQFMRQLVSFQGDLAGNAAALEHLATASDALRAIQALLAPAE
jgi:ParB family chromosome partitioning protein